MIIFNQGIESKHRTGNFLDGFRPGAPLKMKKTSEKRRQKRYRCFVPVEGKRGGVFDQTQTIDISPKGMGLISPRAVSVEERIPVELILKPQSDPVLVLGEVKWVRRLFGSGQYRVGISFADVLQGSPSYLGRYFSAGFF